MDPIALIPAADSLPNHWGWFYFLLLLTFLLHILAMNFLLGGSLIALYERWRGRPATRDAKALPTLVALTVNFGVPPLLFMQVLFGPLLYVSSVLMAVYWIAVIPILILAYYAAYVYLAKSGEQSPWSLWAMLINSLSLLVIAFLFVNNMTMMMEPQSWGAWFKNPGGTVLNLSDPMVWPRFLHFVVGAVAVAGLGRAVLFTLRRKDGDLRPLMVSSGLQTFAYASIAQAVIGLWFLMALKKDVMLVFMGGGTLQTMLLLLGVILGIAVIITALKGRLWLTVGGLCVTLLDMIFLRDAVRSAYLGEAFKLAELPLQPELSPLLAFLLVFVAGVAFLVYLIVRVSRNLGKEAA